MSILTEFFRASKYVELTDKDEHGYLEHIYDKIFADRNKVSKVLEIGIRLGGSVQLWRDWFVNAVIHGVDITPCPSLKNEPRIVTYVGDAYSDAFLKNLPDDFDIIIDDGPHTLDSQLFFVKNYIHKIKPGGLLVLEDILDTSFTPKILAEVPDNYEKTVYDMSDKQKTDALTRNCSKELDVLIRIVNWLRGGNIRHRIVKLIEYLDVFRIMRRLLTSIRLLNLQREWSKGLDVLVVKKPL